MTEQRPAPASQPTGERRRGSSGTAVLGAILIAVGILFLVGRQLDIAWDGAVWPLYVFGPGLVLLALGLSQSNGSGLTVAGSIVVVVGGILFYQELTDHWESWAYAWALVAPGGSGAGMLVFGTRSGNARMARDGFWQIVTGLAIFAVGFVFFEGFIGLSGERWEIPEWVLPAVIIGLGLLVLARALMQGRDGGETRTSTIDDGTG